MRHDITYSFIWILVEALLGFGGLIFYIYMDNQQEEQFKNRLAETEIISPKLPSSPQDHLLITASKLRLMAYEMRSLGLHKQADEVDSEIERIKQKYLNEIKKAA